MKNIILGTIALAFLLMPVMATAQGNVLLKKVESKYVCMINNQVFDKEQIPVEVNGKTYYGCCHMCEETLNNDPASREAVDPVSGKTVDKATATIGAKGNGDVLYFENEDNLSKFEPKE